MENRIYHPTPAPKSGALSVSTPAPTEEILPRPAQDDLGRLSLPISPPRLRVKLAEMPFNGTFQVQRILRRRLPYAVDHKPNRFVGIPRNLVFQQPVKT